MSKPIILLLSAFLALWLLGGAYWLSNNMNSQYKVVKPGTYSFVIKDGDFIAHSETIFAFQTSDADIIINEEQLAVLESLATYLDKESQKQVRLIATFGKDESYFGDYENLGIARAETIKSILTRRGAPATSVKIESKELDVLILNGNGLLSGGIEFDIFDKDISNSITEAIFLKEKIFYFKKNNYNISENKDLEIYAADLKQFMVDEKESKVIISGFREANENDSMALLRAKSIEAIFLKHGIDQERITIETNDADGQNKNKQMGSNDKKVEIKVF